MKKRFILFLMIIVSSFLVVSGQTNNRNKRVIDSLDHISFVVQKTKYKSSKRYIINVNNQHDFDNITETIMEAFSQKYHNIEVNIARGVYFYEENHIQLDTLCEEVMLTIKGNNSSLIAKGVDYDNVINLKESFDPYATYIDLNQHTYFDGWSDTESADSLIEIVDGRKKEFRLPYSKALDKSEEQCDHSYITITQWYQSKTFKVKDIKDGWIHFYADEVRPLSRFGRNGYSVNYDYIYGELNPRFKMFNPILLESKYGLSDPMGTSLIHECKSSCFLSIHNSNIKVINLYGISFLGNRYGHTLLNFDNVTSDEINITRCEFEEIQDTVIAVKNTNNICIRNNHFKGCYRNVIYSGNRCKNTMITSNRFSHCGRILSNTFCIVCSGNNYYIANNNFQNFGYSAIGVGVDAFTVKPFSCSGIIEYNTIGYSDDYFASYEKYTVMDAGAVYLWTQVDDAIVRYNYIYNYTGVKDYRGVFCDDGAGNFKIYGNIIVNTPNCYSIDSRRVDVSELVNYGSNRNNVILYNIVDNRIKLEGADGDSNCIAGGNITLNKPDVSSDANLYSNVERISDDITVDWADFSVKGIYVSPLARKKIKSMPIYSKMKKYIH